MPYQDYISENVLHPLGMNETYWEFDQVPPEKLALGYRWEDEQWKLEPMLHDGAFGSMGGLITSIQDFSKYVSFQLSAWPARNEEETGPVKRSSLREMQTAQFSSLNLENKNINGEPCVSIAGYGYGLGISKDCSGIKRVSHGGALPGFGSNYIFYPDYGVGIMAFGNLTYTGPLPSTKIEKLLFETAQINPRQLPVSDILAKRQGQVLKLIQTWDTNLEKEIVAENLYLDQSREKRMAHVQKIFEKAGVINKTDKIEPWNQLRGRFKIHAENGIIQVYFALTPEKEPKVQDLYITFEQDETNK
jgi:CubicO group peptidase (beta-lactamase class C family)